MNIELLKQDELGQKLAVTITKEDYAEPVKKMLAEHRKKAEFKGFRKGMVPMTMIKKVYGEQVLGEAVNNLISDALNNYIEENKLSLIGEPLMAEDQEMLNWEDGNDFVIRFDLAYSPKFTFQIGKEDKFTNYKIEIKEEAIEERKKAYLQQFGSLQDVQEVKEDDYIVANLDNEDGCRVENTYISIKVVAGEENKKKFVGAKVGDVIEVNVNEAFPNETDRSSMLNTKKEELVNLKPEFKITVVNVKSFVPAEATQETFDKIFGEGQVKSVEEFEAKIKEALEQEYAGESDARLSKDIKNYILENNKFELDEAFLKRWLLTLNRGKFTMEEIEKEFPTFLEGYRWQLLRSYLIEKYEVKIEDKDILEAAEGFVRYQYAMYGIQNIPADMVEKASKQLLEDKKQLTNIIEHVEDAKVFESLKEKISTASKKIDLDKFRTL